MRRHADGRRVAESEEVALVLLEYGARGAGVASTSSGAGGGAGGDKDKKGGGGGARDAAADEEAARRDEIAYQERMQRLAALGGS